MAIPIPRAFVEFVLLGPTNERRKLQDSPMLGGRRKNPTGAPDRHIERRILHPSPLVVPTIQERSNG